MNPLLFGIDGASELSGAGTCYLLARALESAGLDNRDLAALAIIGAIGDMQARAEGLIGPNKQIAQEGADKGVLNIKLGLAFYGKQTRPLPKLLEYSSEFGFDYDNFPFFPYINNKASSVLQIPIHPIGISRLNRSHYSEFEMLKYYLKLLIFYN